MAEGRLRPALTREEWEMVLYRIAEANDEEMFAPCSREDYAVYLLEGGLPYNDREPGVAAHGAAAALLHDQEFGFTREDVVALKVVVRDLIRRCDLGPEGLEEWLEPEIEELVALADRIEALLPPEDLG